MKKARPCELIRITIINILFTIKNSNNQYKKRNKYKYCKAYTKKKYLYDLCI